MAVVKYLADQCVDVIDVLKLAVRDNNVDVIRKLDSWLSYKKIFYFAARVICVQNNLELFKELEKITTIDYDGCLSCINSKNISILKYMIDKIQDPQLGLLASLRFNIPGMVGFFMAKGATDYNEGLIAACHGGNKELIKLMLDKGANNYNKALIGACDKLVDEEIIHLLISKGANNLEPIAKYAIATKNVKLVSMILSKGVKITNAIMEFLCGNGCLDIVSKLSVSSEFDITGMLASARNGHVELVKYFLSKPNPEIESALMEAAIADEVEVMKLLIRHGNYDDLEDAVIEAFNEACCSNSLQVVKYLVNYTTYKFDYNEALLNCVAAEHIDLIKLLIEHGATNLEEFCENEQNTNNREVLMFVLTKLDKIPDSVYNLTQEEMYHCYKIGLWPSKNCVSKFNYLRSVEKITTPILQSLLPPVLSNIVNEY